MHIVEKGHLKKIAAKILTSHYLPEKTVIELSGKIY